MSIITLSHKIKLEPTYKQETYLRQACGVSRFAYNWGLEQWQRQYQEGKKPNGLALKKEFNAIKKEAYPWVYDVTKYACQQPFIYLQRAFTNFFQGRARYPTFKKKGMHDSFYIGNDHIQVKGNRIRLPKIGWIKMREALRFFGKIVSSTVSRVADHWFVSIQVQRDHQIPNCENQAVVGVDLGINHLATLHDGQGTNKVEGSKPLKQLLTKLRLAHRQLSRKEKGSKNWQKQKLKLSRLYYRIRCIRQDCLHKLTTELTQNYHEIVIEDLNVKGMMANRKLARSISDMGFYEFRRQLGYKAELRGCLIHVADRWFPSTKQCSRCHMINGKITLKDRIFRCKDCGLQVDRDENAATNLRNTVSSTGIDACGEGSSGSKECLSETTLVEARTKPCIDLYTF